MLIQRLLFVKATTTTDGSKEVFCNECEKIVETKVIPAASNIALSEETVAYKGSKISPTLTVMDSKGNVIAAENYTQ